MPSLRPGETVGRYRILEEIARGGSAVVYRAQDGRGGPPVALKVLTAVLDLEQRARLEREAQAMRAVSHPNLVAFLEAGEVQGNPFLVLELLEGGTLADQLGRRGRLPWEEAVGHAAKLASALAAIHEAGLVHRDVKPENVLLDAGGEPRLADLGLVRSLSSTGSLTGTGVAVGTLEFLSPEQANGGRELDGRSDLYSLGATLHALVAGEPPFRGAGFQLLRAHALEPPPPLGKLVPGVPAPLEELVLRLLAKVPERRPESALAVASALEAIVAKSAVRTRSPARLALAAGAVLALAGVAVWVQRSRAARAAEDARREKADEEARAQRLAEEHDAPAVRWLARARDALARAARALHETDPGPARGELGATLEAVPAAAAYPRLAARLASAEADLRIARARVALDLTEILPAVADAARALELAPRSAIAHALLGEGHAQSERIPEANLEATRALELDPRCARAHVVRAWVAILREDDRPRAREAVERALALEPDLAVAHALAAMVATFDGDLDAARAQRDHALEIQPWCVAALRHRSRSAFVAGDTDRSLADDRRIVDLVPGSEPAWVDLAMVQGARDDPEALRSIDRAVALAPRSAYARRMRVTILGWAGKLVEAAAEADRLVALQDGLEERLEAAEARLAAGSGHYRGALADASRAVELAPGDARGWRLLGEARVRVHDVRAGEAIARAVELAPEDPEVLALAGSWAFTSRRYDEALARAEAALARGPSAPAFALRSRCRLYQRDLARAREDAEAARRTAPRRPDGWAALAFVHEDEGQVTDARDAADQALRRGASEGAFTVRAIARFRLGDRDGALADAEQVLAWSSADPRLVAIRAEVRRSKGDAAAYGEDRERLLARADLTSDTFVRVAELAMIARDPGLVRELARRGLELAPGALVLVRVRAEAARLLGDHAAALRDVERVLAASPTADTVAARASLLLELDRRDEAIAEARRAVALEPGAEECAAALLQALYVSGRHDDGVAVVTAWTEAHGGQSSALLAIGLAEIRARQGSLDEARDVARGLVGVLPGVSDVRALEGEVERRRGDRPAAVAALEAAVAVDPECAAARCSRALLRLDSGDRDGARAELEAFAGRVSRTALVHDPALEALARLRSGR